ncbi:hypothetical protein SAMN05444394_3281 [Algoriphagus halophilus]|uniref:Uncharacterized protein n=1 Tax=Algoriphagus halophilus TaxID=226505 RepID=A0A1N6GIN2_9BACT|nr:hypothetical protein SAMN05444394_3281 [Algoriphagus halophilus]
MKNPKESTQINGAELQKTAQKSIKYPVLGIGTQLLVSVLQGLVGLGLDRAF